MPGRMSRIVRTCAIENIVVSKTAVITTIKKTNTNTDTTEENKSTLTPLCFKQFVHMCSFTRARARVCISRIFALRKHERTETQRHTVAVAANT